MLNKNVAVVGSGGREHTLCWKLNQSDTVSKIFAIPGNGGTATCKKVTNVDIDATNFEALILWLKEYDVSMVVVGSEVPLASGISNVIRKNNIMCFGPTAEASKIESDKKWAKQFMNRHHIPTAQWKSFKNTNEAKNFIKTAPFKALVIKAAGLAAGKGVIVANNVDEACDAVDTVEKQGSAADVIIVEERLDGEEVSVLAFTDGNTVKVMLPVQDHKRLLNNDEGPNTGGMGAFCPYALTKDEMEFIECEIMQHTVSSLASELNKFVGVLYAGLMITKDGIKVLEFNCRFGDPETQVLMPLLDSDLYKIFEDCCTGHLQENRTVKWKQNTSCVGVVIASKEYPYSSSQPQPVSNFSKFEEYRDLYIFHGNTSLTEKGVLARGGRVFNVVALDSTLTRASARATRACGEVEFPGAQFRTDIGWKGITRSILKHGKSTYQSAGVNITAGNNFIKSMKTQIESTFNDDVVSSIGGFGALYDAKFSEYRHPILVSGCDGVGTKLKIAQKCQNHTTIGQDLVAMCVNDILAQGAKPLFFLDYFACGQLKENIASNVIAGISKGCKLADCALVGGETAEMPGFYKNDEYDLAGFAVGVVEKEVMLPQGVQEGDKVIYLPSSGIHSNGYSLVQKIFADYTAEDLSTVAPFSSEGKTFGEELLTPTKIYTREILPLVEKRLIKAFAHITGGGLLENIGRVLLPYHKVELDALAWNISPVFGWIAAIGGVNEEEMLRTFNCGVGGVVIASPENVGEIIEFLQTDVIGEVKVKGLTERQVQVRNFEKAILKVMNPLIPVLLSPKYTAYKRVAVMISGTGTNLKALIESTINDPHSPAKIVYVISSRANVKGIDIAEENGIPYQVIQRNRQHSTEDNDRPIVQALQKEKIDIVCLAGYMHILSDWFVKQWSGKMINIHPSLLPSFKGLAAQKQALNAEVKFTGCTVHFVEAEVDSGGIIDQRVVPIYSNDTEEILVERIKEYEHQVFPYALKLLASGKIKLDSVTKKVIWH
ncbi:trifunctional purine biosynthetic protein adenosine-3-like [Planococcus citri]|uniref:trifunctional purine biosynthetic protein adenosine-3-like n=1 Tax=Planococcus citri TaxID=170843 RepID=UPI0031F74C36